MNILQTIMKNVLERKYLEEKVLLERYLNRDNVPMSYCSNPMRQIGGAIACLELYDACKKRGFTKSTTLYSELIKKVNDDIVSVVRNSNTSFENVVTFGDDYTEGYQLGALYLADFFCKNPIVYSEAKQVFEKINKITTAMLEVERGKTPYNKRYIMFDKYCRVIDVF